MKKRIAAAFMAFFIIMLACTLLAFALVAVNTMSYIGSYKHYENDSDYFSVNAQVVSFFAYTNSYVFEIDQSSADGATFFEITGENFNLIKDKGLDKLIKEGDSITFTAAITFVGASWNRTIVAFTYEGTEYFSFEVGKANLLAQQHAASDNAIKTNLITGSLLLFSALGLGLTYLISKKKKIFSQKNSLK